MESVFNELSKVNVNEFTEKKGKLTYLTWSKAWEEVKKRYPDASYKILENENGLPCFGNKENGYIVKTTVTIKGETLPMWLAIMDNYNKAILQPVSTQISNSLMRCLTKNLAMFGLGLYIYAGEDLPSEETAKAETPPSKSTEKIQVPKASDEQIQAIRDICDKYKVDVLTLYASNNITESTITKAKASEFIDGLKKKFEGK